MTPSRTFIALLLALSAMPLAARAQDVFSQADLLRKALVDRDEAALRALDGSGEIGRAHV